MSTSNVRSDPLVVGDKDGRPKSYTTPQLKLLGSVRELTDGGSGNANEGSSGLRPRP